MIWILTATFALDALFELDVLQRATVSLAGSTILLAVVLYRVRPYLAVRETEVDLALLVERLHALDTDLVAAIEFTRPAAAAWGSAALRGAVIRQMEHRGSELDMGRAIDRRAARRHLCLLALAGTLLACVGGLFPAHFATFWRRLAWSDEHYPSQTRISRIEVNGQLVLSETGAATPRAVRCAEQAPVEVVVSCQRRPPAAGELLVRDSHGGPARRVSLARQAAVDTAAGTGEILFAAQLPPLLDSLRYQVFLGDAWTNSAEIEMIPLPQIELQLDVEPPAYARAQAFAEPQPGAYRATVLQGSRVDLTLRCVNGKRLSRVWADVYSSSRHVRQELVRKDAEAARWHLDGATCEPLRSVEEAIRFELSVTDEDGLQPMRLPNGELRVRADMPPEGVAATIHRLVLPAARPSLAYRVLDDFGISRLRLQIQIQRYRSGGQEADAAATPAETHFLDIGGIDLSTRRKSTALCGALCARPAPLATPHRRSVESDARDNRLSGHIRRCLGTEQPVILGGF